MLLLIDLMLYSLCAVSYLCWPAMQCFLCSLYRIGPYQTFFNRIVTFTMIWFLSVLGNTWTVDATFQDTEFTQIAMYSPTRGIASTSQSVLHTHFIGELRVWVRSISEARKWWERGREWKANLYCRQTDWKRLSGYMNHCVILWTSDCSRLRCTILWCAVCRDITSIGSSSLIRSYSSSSSPHWIHCWT